MPNPKDPIKLAEYKEKQRKIALEKGFGKWMTGRKNTPGLKALKVYILAVKGTKLKLRRTRTCEYCRKVFYPYPYQKSKRYCSRKCYSDSPARKEEYAKRCIEYWNDRQRKGYTRPYLTGEAKYRKWRTAVFQRDNWTCQTCNSKGYVEGHHIKSWINFPELRYEIDNGVTLCKECHKLANKIQRENE